MTRLVDIQTALKAPKNQRNSFGGYNYRSCEDILEAVKPLLGDASLVVYDEVVMVGDRYYVKATADLQCEEGRYQVTGYAREAEIKKGMDDSQITGSASSYARKYALNGLFCIDDTRDADATNDHGKSQKAAPPKKPQQAQQPDPTEQAKNRLKAAVNVYAVKKNADKKALFAGIKKRPDFADTAEFYNATAEEFEAAVDIR